VIICTRSVPAWYWAAQLDDALGDAVGVLELLGRVLQELLGREARLDARGDEVVSLVPQRAHPLGR
jgi:hypothetical protein